MPREGINSIVVYLSDEEKAAVVAAAKKEQRSVSQMARLLIVKGLRR